MSLRRTHHVDFRSVASSSLPHLPAIAARWLPDGKRHGAEWVARNPMRTDKSPGSFKVNLRTGRWSDVATGSRGGDVISLAAYLFGLSQPLDARRIAQMIGMREPVK